MINLRPANYLLQRWVLRRPFLDATIPEYGLRLRVHTNDVIGRHLYKYRRYEPEVTRLLLATVRLEPGDVVFDVGANIGWYSLVLDRQAPPGVDILAFEPDPDNHALLRENLARNGTRGVTAWSFSVFRSCTMNSTGLPSWFVLSSTPTIVCLVWP